MRISTSDNSDTHLLLGRLKLAHLHSQFFGRRREYLLLEDLVDDDEDEDEDGAPDAAECAQQTQQEEEDDCFDDDVSVDESDDVPVMHEYDFGWIDEFSARWWEDADSAQWWAKLDKPYKTELTFEDLCGGFSAVPPKAWRCKAESSLAEARGLFPGAEHTAQIIALVKRAFEARAARKLSTGTGNCFDCREHAAACTCIPGKFERELRIGDVVEMVRLCDSDYEEGASLVLRSFYTAVLGRIHNR